MFKKKQNILPLSAAFCLGGGPRMESENALRGVCPEPGSCLILPCIGAFEKGEGPPGRPALVCLLLLGASLCVPTHLSSEPSTTERITSLFLSQGTSGLQTTTVNLNSEGKLNTDGKQNASSVLSIPDLLLHFLLFCSSFFLILALPEPNLQFLLTSALKSILFRDIFPDACQH